jgi:hypothetical protein
LTASTANVVHKKVESERYCVDIERSLERPRLLANCWFRVRSRLIAGYGTRLRIALLAFSKGVPEEWWAVCGPAGKSARAMLAEIYDWFTEGFDTADLKAAKALLDESSP